MISVGIKMEIFTKSFWFLSFLQIDFCYKHIFLHLRQSLSFQIDEQM